MLIVSDLDGTIDAEPALFQQLYSALRAAGVQVAVLTGCHGGGDQVTPADVAQKQEYMSQIGFDAYDQLVVFSTGGGANIAQLKAQWCAAHNADLMVDNDRGNAEAAQGQMLVLVPWATRVGNKKDGK